MEVIRYSAKYKVVWDAFVASSKNGTFLFQRDYMEYHADRFTDHSLLFYKDNKLIAILPANEAGTEIHSHGGLSYGGILSNEYMRAAIMLDVFEAMCSYFRQQGFVKMKYKAIPYIYHQLPSEEDLYALFRHEAILCRRDVNTVISLTKPVVGYNTLRKRKMKAAALLPLALGQSFAFRDFMKLEQELLIQKYNTAPVHTADEVERLASLFPDHIRLYTACEGSEILAGVLIYETATVAHAQYIASSERGRNTGAPDLLFDWLLKDVYPHKRYFSFGVSTEQQGQYLNLGLVRNKESYGGRTVVHDFYDFIL